MRSIFARMWRAVGVFRFVVLMLGVGVIITGYVVVPHGPSWRIPLIWVFWLACGLGALVVSASRYGRSASAKPYREVGPALVASRQEFCLLLRPFGSDGELLLRNPRKRQRLFFVFETKTAEQAVGDAVASALGLPTYAIVDQSRTLSPPGVTFVRATNEEWQTAAATLIRRAHSIVLLIPPEEVRDGFRWEIAQLAKAGLQDRVILFMPPATNHDVDLSARASYVMAGLATGGLDETETAMAALDIQFHLDDRVCLARYSERDGLLQWFPMARDGRLARLRGRSGTTAERRVSTKVTYPICVAALQEALSQIKRELSQTGFEGRYPFH
jgi:hypothetical protein